MHAAFPCAHPFPPSSPRRGLASTPCSPLHPRAPRAGVPVGSARGRAARDTGVEGPAGSATHSLPERSGRSVRHRKTRPQREDRPATGALSAVSSQLAAASSTSAEPPTERTARGPRRGRRPRRVTSARAHGRDSRRRQRGRHSADRPGRGAGGGGCPAGGNDFQWCFSQVKGAIDEDVAEADIISTVEFNYSGDLLATGDKGGRVVIFQREQENKSRPHSRGEYNVYSTFQSHEPEFDYLKSLEIEEKINKIRWLPQQNAAHFLLSTNDKTIKLWKISERDKRAEGYNLKDEDGRLRDPFRITALRVPILKPMDLMVEASPRRIFANAHTYHINSISVNSDHETYLSADDLRINLWHLEITDRSFNIVDIKPANMEELTEVITAAELHPRQCNVFVYSSSKGTVRLCDMRSSALCDRHSKFFEEPEDPSSRSFFSEIISSISDVKFSHSGRYMITRDYLSVKVWDLNMESRPVETHQVHEYLRSKLCSLYENDCIFDKFECCWNGSDSAIMTGSYNNFFRMFDRNTRRDITLEASRENSKPRAILKPRKVCTGGKRKKDEISVDSLDFSKKILHTAWHPLENIIAVAATNNLYIFQDKVN
ncbi:serine/threonine-protein phosphatase 2A 55 kDa regulatory subunit B delta isoform isoform X1 [Choloepus didactylus]|uniref:serine/threonine-protein phosphatase 2A 55 kDa regulatory subunit B delta isoform isoform X1 n=1 Tax=Choloepus didactylus TaxID=27675 RepID=UPI00189D00EA|nr:serine/threonine-protein phosphatase 2A 55 kDa regulatory subunit B delta isoform isoform X1 [Choloepus didactylus]